MRWCELPFVDENWVDSKAPCTMESMTKDTRRRILVTDTPAVSALISSHARPGEARAATLVRLAERGGAEERTGSRLSVLRGFEPAFMTMNATDIINNEDDQIAAESLHG